MTLTDAHREQIRALVDAVEDPTATDIVFMVSTSTTSRRGRRVATGVALVLVAALVAVGVVFATRHDEVTGHTSVLAVTPTVPTACVVDADGNGGCTMRPAKASRYLGFRARVPEGVPHGWVVERKQLRVYRNPLPANEGGGTLPPGVESLAVYNQIWTPRGTVFDVAGTCPTSLQVRQRRVLPGEHEIVGEPTVDLGGGTVVYGLFASPSDCGGTQVVSTQTHWMRDGISFTVNATNVDREQMIGIVESLYDS